MRSRSEPEISVPVTGVCRPSTSNGPRRPGVQVQPPAGLPVGAAVGSHHDPAVLVGEIEQRRGAWLPRLASGCREQEEVTRPGSGAGGGAVPPRS